MQIRASLPHPTVHTTDETLKAGSSREDISRYLQRIKSKIKRKDRFSLSVQLFCLIAVLAAAIYACFKMINDDDKTPSRKNLKSSAMTVGGLSITAVVIAGILIFNRFSAPLSIADELTLSELDKLSHFYEIHTGKPLETELTIDKVILEIEEIPVSKQELIPLLGARQ